MERPMISSVGSPREFSQPALVVDSSEDFSSGVSWAAVMGGAFVIAALSLILLALGSGLGFSAVSPWVNAGVSLSTLGAGAILWLILMQFIASAIGGYIAGRLRTRWVRIHNDEVFFRDTAHGLLPWAVAAVVTAAFLASAAAMIIGGVVQAGSVIAGTGSSQPTGSNPSADRTGYYTDLLFRSESPDNTVDLETREEAARILAIAVTDGTPAAADTAYLAQMVAARADLSESEAAQRVSTVIDQSKQALDAARKAAAKTSLWTFVALLVGAFSASYAATIGGRLRDHVQAV